MKLHKAKVSSIRPTQIGVGFLEVEAKKKELKKLSEKDLDKYLEENPVPCVLGPNETRYCVDHHHLCKALTEMEVKECYFNIIHDFSTVQEIKFFKVMAIMDLVYLYDENGRDASIYQIPKKITDLKDDPYRSLAGFVRKRKGFFKVDVPFSEFKWANFFFQHGITKELIENDLDTAIADALVLAVSDEARYLPGWTG